VPTRKRIGAIKRVIGNKGQEIRVSFWDDDSILITVRHRYLMTVSHLTRGSRMYIRVVSFPSRLLGQAGLSRD